MIKYKALITDCDGTLIQSLPNALPSEKVIQAIKLAQTHLHVGIATSRNLPRSLPIAHALHLKGLSIIHGGAILYDFTSSTICAEYPIPITAVSAVYEATTSLGYPLIIDNNKQHTTMTAQSILSHPIFGAFVINLSHDQATELKGIISTIPDISSFLMPAWEPEKFDVGFTSIHATKQNGVRQIATLLGISPNEIIGVGDGQNDLPLLTACGLKVAMGNAVEELKVIADYIAPTIDEDGIVDIIHRFIF